jgi:hypothetical protein
MISVQLRGASEIWPFGFSLWWLVLDEEEEGVIMTTYTRKYKPVSWYYPCNYLAPVGFRFLPVRMVYGIFYAHLNGMGLVIRWLLYCMYNTSLCDVPFIDLRIAKSHPTHSQIPSSHLVTHPPLYMHYPPSVSTYEVAICDFKHIANIHDFLNTPVV